MKNTQRTTAAAAYDRAALELYGEFARLNNPTLDEKRIAENKRIAADVRSKKASKAARVLWERRRGISARILAQIAAQNLGPDELSEMETKGNIQ